MILEITGLPGAGKSACESLLCDRLRERGFQVMLHDDLIRSYVRDRIYPRLGLSYRLRRRRWVRAVVSLLYRGAVVRCELAHRLAIGGLAGAVAKAQRRACRRLSQDVLLFRYFLEECSSPDEAERVHVASEGLVHHTAALRVWAGPRYSAMADRWIGRQGCDDIAVVHVQTPPDAALQRLWQRGLPRSWPGRTRSHKAAAGQTLADFAEAIQQSIEQYQAAGARVFTLDNSGDLEALAAGAAALVESLPLAAAAGDPQRASGGGDQTTAGKEALRR